MRPRVTLAITRHNLRLVLGDPSPVIIYLAIPLLSMVVMKPTQEEVLVGLGYPDANGAEQVVPGFMIMFIFLWMLSIGRTFFVEHGWGTWERLRASSATTGEIVIGKLAPGFLLMALQILLSFALGFLLLDLNSEGPALALVIVWVPLITCVLAMTAAFVGLVRTYAELDAAGNLVLIVFAAIGGCLTPVDILPETVQDIAPAVPSYWANEAALDVLLKGEGLSAMWAPAGVLLLFTAFFAAIAAVSFITTQTKRIEI